MVRNSKFFHKLEVVLELSSPAALVEIAVELGLRVMQKNLLFHFQIRNAAL